MERDAVRQIAEQREFVARHWRRLDCQVLPIYDQDMYRMDFLRSRPIVAIDRLKEDKPGYRLYDARWARYSRARLNRFPICARCQGFAVVTDHIIPYRGDRGLFWSAENHQSLCKSCHNAKSAIEKAEMNKYKEGVN